MTNDLSDDKRKVWSEEEKEKDGVIRLDSTVACGGIWRYKNRIASDCRANHNNIINDREFIYSNAYPIRFLMMMRALLSIQKSLQVVVYRTREERP